MKIRKAFIVAWYSGDRIRRASWESESWAIIGSGGKLRWDDEENDAHGKAVQLDACDILATDWEIEE